MEHFERLQVLGNGCFGVASLVRERDSQTCSRPVQLRVVKEVDLSVMPQSAREEAENEVEVLRALSHENVIAYHDAFLENGRLHIVMEFAAGGDLAAAIVARKEENRRFEQSEALRILEQSCA